MTSNQPNQSREACVELADPCLEPKHKIFLCHSGAQKPFTEHLCERLEAVQHFAFFDKRADCLRKGERFYPPLMKAAKECRVAVLVLSNEFFTGSKWPMMELKEFCVAQAEDNPGLKILPLFFKITRKEFNKRRSGTKWEAVWKGFREDDGSIDVAQWKHALSRIQGNNGLQYGGETEGEAEFIKKVVAAVCRLLPPDVKWDVSHVQRVEQLCEPILKKLKEVERSDRYKVPVVGLYGMGGVGKSTITRAVCNQVFGEFAGKVCHVELGSRSPSELLKSVLRELTEASLEILVDDWHKLVYLLKQRMHRQRVFLVLDNVWEKDIEEVETYLNAGYSDGSMVLVTARSAEVLSSRLHIGERSCMEMPMLDEDGATDVFLQYSGLVRASVKDEEWEIVRRCVKKCCFEIEVGSKKVGYRRLYEKQSCYHPLALKVFGIEVGSVGVGRMVECLGKVAANKLIMSEDKAHGVFSVLKVGYDALRKEEQLLFLDLALVWSAKWSQVIVGNRYKGKWLRTIHRFDTTADMERSVKALQSKGLLQRVADLDRLDYSIHDLYLEFAEVEARTGALEGRRFLIDRRRERRSEVPHELRKHPPNGLCWPYLIRLVIHNNQVQSLKRAKLHLCKNLEVLDLDRCEVLEELDVTGMEYLRCVVVSHCGQLRRWKGLEDLSDLAILCWTGPRGPSQNCITRNFVEDLLSLTALEVLTLKDLSWSGIDAFPPNLSGCTKLRQLTISSNFPVYPAFSAADIGESLPKSLIKIDITLCPIERLKDSHAIGAMSLLKNLRDLNLKFCILKDLTGLGELICLEKLCVGQTDVCMLPDDLWKLKQLWFLDISYCLNLQSLAGLAHATALQRLNAHACNSLEELSPGDFFNLKKLQHLDVGWCQKLKSIVGIVHATALRRVNAGFCGNLTRLPDEFSGLEELEMLELTEDRNIRDLPEDYKWLAGHAGSKGTSRVRVRGCWGLIEGLLERLRGPEMSRLVKCNECESMQAWTDGMKNVDGAAYYWLTEILSEEESFDYFWKYRLDDDEARHVVTRALCEHFIRGTLCAELLAEVTHRARRFGKHHWVVVATAPSTFAVVTKKAALEPGNETLLQYTIEQILAKYIGVKEWRAMFCTYMGRGKSESQDVEGKVDVIDSGSLQAAQEPYTVDPDVLRELVKPLTESKILPEYNQIYIVDDSEAGDSDEDGDDVSNNRSWLRKAIVAVFQKCIEKFEEAGMPGTDCMRIRKGKEVVDTLLTVIEAATGEELMNDSILWILLDDLKKAGRVKKWYAASWYCPLLPASWSVGGHVGLVCAAPM